MDNIILSKQNVGAYGVRTRCGYRARKLCWDLCEERKIVAAVYNPEQHKELIYIYYPNGRRDEIIESEFDLVLKNVPNDVLFVKQSDRWYKMTKRGEKEGNLYYIYSGMGERTNRKRLF